MKLEEKIGQLMMIGIESCSLATEEKSFIKENCVGGIILFERNYESLKQIINLTSEIQAIYEGIPILIAVDQEGGRVQRFKAPFSHLPSPLSIGKLVSLEGNSVKISYETAKIIGKELNAVGINMNLAPVLDLNTTPDNKVIGDRSFGNDPIKVAKIGLSIVAGLQDHGVIACGKHFPGHGHTNKDSHKELPVIPHSLARLSSVELKPFIHCIKNGMLSIMTAHIKFPGIDKEHPASLSETITGKLLRKTLKFTGIVISDDLCMGAISNNYKIADAAVNCIIAGSDMVIVSKSLSQQKKAFDTLVKAASSGAMPQSRIDESISRILRIKKGFLSKSIPDLKTANKTVGSSSHSKFVEKLSAEIRESA